MKKQSLLLVVGILLVVTISLYFYLQPKDNSITGEVISEGYGLEEEIIDTFTFYFSVEENGQILDGEVIINNKTLGFTENGSFEILKGDIPETDEFEFKGIYNDYINRFQFEFLPEDIDSNAINFVISGYDLRGYSLEDNFDYLNVRYDSSDLTYSFADEEQCGDIQNRRTRNAFEEIQKAVDNVITFSEVSGRGNIVIFCPENKPEIEGGWITQGEGSPLLEGNEIVSGEVYLYLWGVGGTYTGGCVNYPDLEIHEILHTFGFEHTFDIKSIMYPDLSRCRYRIDEGIVDKLKEIYG